jgi:lipid A ethanolaminephosphotransferase
MNEPFKHVKTQSARRTVRFASPVTFALSMAALFLVFFNLRFWQDTALAYWHGNPADAVFLFTLGLVLLLLYTAALLLMPGNTLMIVVAGLLFPLGSMAAFCADNFGLAINSEMIRNLGATDRREALALFSPRIVLYTVCFGVLPLFLVARSRIAPLDLRCHLRHRLVFCGVALLVATPLVGLQAARLSDFVMHRKDLHYLSVPGAAVQGLVAYTQAHLEHGRYAGASAASGAPRRIASAAAAAQKPLLVFLVIGETARHGNFQLGGYDRPTNPGLSKTEGVYYFDQVTACATTTAVSVPCMLSHLGRERFSLSAAARSPNVLSELAQAGVEVSLRTNNSGSKGISGNRSKLDFSDSRSRPWCDDAGCLDGILLQGLEAGMPESRADRLLVFHQMGSHGPAYFERYPQTSEVFRPACRSNDIGRCSLEEIRNAYDNTIVYTDQLLTEQIGLLRKASDKFDTALVFLSDHGESLGENGLHLHGAPYEVAPEEQLRIPLIVWMSDGYRARFGIDGACLRRQQSRPYSHDNLYHTLLGAMGVRTDFYRGKMDVLEACVAAGN